MFGGCSGNAASIPSGSSRDARRLSIKSRFPCTRLIEVSIRDDQNADAQKAPPNCSPLTTINLEQSGHANGVIGERPPMQVDVVHDDVECAISSRLRLAAISIVSA